MNIYTIKAVSVTPSSVKARTYEAETPDYAIELARADFPKDTYSLYVINVRPVCEHCE